jgi:superoxide reductase
MKNELIIKKCNSCGALVRVFDDCTCENCGIQCCGEAMQTLIPNTTEASAEKHIPTYERIEDEIYVKINHPMEKEHYIEWIALVKDNQEFFVKLYPEQNAECRFKYIPGSTIYSYCNKHNLWKAEVE